jgi:hypothetical protein
MKNNYVDVDPQLKIFVPCENWWFDMLDNQFISTNAIQK